MPELPKRIVLKGNGYRHEEFPAAAAVTPGKLLIRTSAGAVQHHNVENGYAERAYALEDALQGKTIANAYALSDIVGVGFMAPGDVVYAWLDAGENIVISDQLSSAGNGNLQKTTGTNIPVAIAEEAVDNNDSGAVAVRIRVRVL
jgi:hypothetical protein